MSKTIILAIAFLATIMILGTSFMPTYAQSEDEISEYQIIITPSDNSSIIHFEDWGILDEDYILEITSEDDLPTVNIDHLTVQVYGLDNGVEYPVTLTLWYQGWLDLVTEEILISSLYDPPQKITLQDLQDQITSLETQLILVNVTVQENVTKIDDLYGFWDGLRASIITWLDGRP